MSHIQHIYGIPVTREQFFKWLSQNPQVPYYNIIDKLLNNSNINWRLLTKYFNDVSNRNVYDTVEYLLDDGFFAFEFEDRCQGLKVVLIEDSEDKLLLGLRLGKTKPSARLISINYELPVDDFKKYCGTSLPHEEARLYTVQREIIKEKITFS